MPTGEGRLPTLHGEQSPAEHHAWAWWCPRPRPVSFDTLKPLERLSAAQSPPPDYLLAAALVHSRTLLCKAERAENGSPNMPWSSCLAGAAPSRRTVAHGHMRWPRPFGTWPSPMPVAARRQAHRSTCLRAPRSGAQAKKSVNGRFPSRSVAQRSAVCRLG